MDKKIKAIEKKTKSLQKDEKNLLKMDKKHDKKLEKCDKMMMKKKTDPDIHIICGKCGHTDFDFKFDKFGNDDGELYPVIFLCCKNCSTVTGLDEIVEDKTDWKYYKFF